MDSYGDIILQRYVDDAFGNKVPVKDVYPLIRGGFESYRGVDYDDSTDKNKLSTVNIQVRGITPIDINSQNNQVVLTHHEPSKYAYISSIQRALFYMKINI